jgi:hypothetical protein
LYLLKLHNGKDFGTRAGALWRLLFVLALMPWLRNYRVRPDLSSPEEEDGAGPTRRRRRSIFDDNKEEEGGGGERRRSILDNYADGTVVVKDDMSESHVQGGSDRRVGPREDLQEIHPLEMELVQQANARLLQQNRDLVAALRLAREKLLLANIPMDVHEEQLQLQALSAPALTTSTYFGVTLVGESFPGRIVLSPSGLSYYSGLEEEARLDLSWKEIVKNERNSGNSDYNLVRLTTSDGERHEFLLRSRSDRASLRQEIAGHMESQSHRNHLESIAEEDIPKPIIEV